MDIVRDNDLFWWIKWISGGLGDYEGYCRPRITEAGKAEVDGQILTQD